MGNRCGGEESEIHLKDIAVTPDTGTRAPELDIDCYSMTLHKPRSSTYCE